MNSSDLKYHQPERLKYHLCYHPLDEWGGGHVQASIAVSAPCPPSLPSRCRGLKAKLLKYYHHCCCSISQSYSTLYDPMDCSMPSFPVLHYLPGFAQTHVHWLSESIQQSHYLMPPSPPAVSLLQDQGLFQWVGIRWPKYWSFSFSISPSNEYSGLIFLRIDWFDLLAVQRTFKNLLQQHSCKASVLWCSNGIPL